MILLLSNRFSTLDDDNDGNATTHCAELLGSGWWFSGGVGGCGEGANLNGRWNDAAEAGMHWRAAPLVFSEMKIRLAVLPIG